MTEKTPILRKIAQRPAEISPRQGLAEFAKNLAKTLILAPIVALSTFLSAIEVTLALIGTRNVLVWVLFFSDV